MYNYHSINFGNEIWAEYKAIASCNPKVCETIQMEEGRLDLYSMVKTIELLL